MAITAILILLLLCLPSIHARSEAFFSAAMLFLFLEVIAMSFAEQSENTQEKEERPYGSVMMDRLTGSNGGRIDHVLQVRAFTVLALYSGAAILVHLHD